MNSSKEIAELESEWLPLLLTKLLNRKVLTIIERRKHFSDMLEIISPNNCPQPREEAIYSYPMYATDLCKGLCMAHDT